MNLKDLTREQLKQLMGENTIQQIADIYSVSRGTISARISKFELSYEQLRLDKYPTCLTDKQKEFMVGSLLGDGFVGKDGHYSLTQTLKSKSYVNYVFNLLSPFTKYLSEREYKSPIKKNGIIVGKGDKSTTMSTTSTIIHPIFKDLRKKWYNEIKTVPQDIKLTPYSLAVWYADDGCNRNSKHSKDIRLNTQGFSVKEVDFLLYRLKEDLDIVGGITWDNRNNKKQPIIRIGAYYYFQFIDIVKPFIKEFGCFDYKIDTSKAPGKKKIISREEVRNLYGTMTQRAIAKKLGARTVTICYIVKELRNKKLLSPKTGQKYLPTLSKDFDAIPSCLL